MYTPCETCKLRFNREYSSECDLACDYAKSILILRDTKSKLEHLSEMPADSQLAKMRHGIKEILSDLAEL